MSAKTHADVGDDGLDGGAVRKALDRLLADSRFKVADRQRAILSYLVEKRLGDDDAEAVKAYSIAIDVLGRSSNFDPMSDPIVRIEISRLRSSLESYYSANGYDHDIWISIKKGKYIACFTSKCSARTDEHDEYDSDCLSTDDVIIPRSVGSTLKNLSPRKWLVPLLGVVAVVALTAYAYTSPVRISEKPTVYVSAEAPDPAQAGDASQMRDGLLTALTRFQTLTVAQPSFASARNQAPDRKYAIELKYYGDGDEKSVWWQVVETVTGKLLGSGLERVETTGKNGAAVRDEIVALLAKRIASNRGVISTVEMDSNPLSLGNGCVIRAEYALDVGGDLTEAAGCLQRTLRHTPEDADANAMMARVLIAPGGKATASDLADHALGLAREAVSRAPLSDRSQLALMAALDAKGRTQAAIEAGNRAMALNPNNPDGAAALGGVLYAAGYRAAGVSMARDASKDADVVPRCAMVVLALEAFRDARYSEALLWSEQVRETSVLASAIRAASAGELGSGDPNLVLDETGISGPKFRNTVKAVGLQPDLVSMLEQGLSKAGVDIEPVGSISR